MVRLLLLLNAVVSVGLVVGVLLSSLYPPAFDVAVPGCILGAVGGANWLFNRLARLRDLEVDGLERTPGAGMDDAPSGA